MAQNQKQSQETFVLEIVTPQGVTFSGEVGMVVLPGTIGELGILPNHAPLLTLLKPGLLTLTGKDNQQTSHFVSDGFADVSNGFCTVLVEEAMPKESINRELAEKRYQAATYAVEDARTDVERRKAEQSLVVATALQDYVQHIVH